LNVHPSFAVNSPGPTIAVPFAPGALYEIRIDTDGDAVADLNYSVQFSSSEDGRKPQQCAGLKVRRPLVSVRWFDRQVIAAGMERVRAEIEELQQNGLLDAQIPDREYLPAQIDV
jgi:hypothetical protein